VSVHGEALLDGNDGAGWLRSASSAGQQFGEEAQVWAVLEEVALAQPDRWWLARMCAALQRGGAAEQGRVKWSLASPFDVKATDKGDDKRGRTWGDAILGAVETEAVAVPWARRRSVGAAWWGRVTKHACPGHWPFGRWAMAH
jgi:hypothetical protein